MLDACLRRILPVARIGKTLAAAADVRYSIGLEKTLMRWITRKNVKVDRVACPWLIKHFIDAEAEFLFVKEDELCEKAEREGAIPFDAPNIPAIKLNHRGSRCTFEAIIEDYAITDPTSSSWHSSCALRTLKARKAWRLKGLVCVR